MTSRSEGKLMLREDWIFLQRQLDRLPRKQRAAVKDEYQRIFMEAYDTEPIEYRKGNAGRRAANLWLLDQYGALSNERAWIQVPVSEADIEWARRRHGEYQGGNDIARYAQWEGILGELVFDHFLAGQDLDYTWLNRERDQGREDFRIGKIQIDTKTTGREYRPKQHWTIGVAKHQAIASARHFFWIVYQRDPGDLAWIIGGLPSRRFMRLAWRNKKSEDVHANFNVRESMYNINIMVPYPWEIYLEKING